MKKTKIYFSFRKINVSVFKPISRRFDTMMYLLQAGLNYLF